MMPQMRPTATRSLSLLRDLIVCPACMGPLTNEGNRLACSSCGRTYPVADGTPVFVQESIAQHDELDHLIGDHASTDADSHKVAQSAFFDRAELAEFEIERPTGAPEFYKFLLGEKFRRSVKPFQGRLDGWTALTVCGGSGMDAEFLAATGASVISSDISLGAASRVRERASRHGVSVLPIVADVEHLPFADRSVDVVYVHDGLHHLEDPSTGIAEMVRVARRAVCISEPARAAATSIAVRLGLALDREDAGNQVARLEPDEISAVLESAGFHVVQAERYAMYYRHVPGWAMGLLSRQPLLPLAVLGWRLANGLVGRFGNKLTVVGLR